jgi:gliding motility-associated-like protein
MLSKEVRVVIYFVFFFLGQIDATGKNIIGGYLQIKNLDNTIAHFRITLKLHINETEGGFSDNEVTVKMIKTVDGSVRDSFKLVRTASQSVSYSKETCAGSQELNTVYATFETDVLVHPEHYVDPKGYYLEWTDCCRAVNVVNLKNSESYTTTLRTQCPPIIQAYREFFNSTPTISDLNQFYICNSQPFIHQLTAGDLDGDSLNFSVVIPVGYHSGSKLPLEFASGCGPLDVVPGRPSLHADPKTGLLTVFPETNGYFAFGVLLEEYRNGQRISATIREYALHVVDCSLEAADKNVYLNDAPVTSTTICQGNTVTFIAKINPDWRYQWMRNGKEISGATANALEVSQEGEYSFNVFRSGDCAQTVESQKVHVTNANSSFKLEKHGTSTSCEQPGETVLVGPKDLHYSYNWYKNGSLLAEKSNLVIVIEPGNYWAIVESSLCNLFSDTLAIEQTSNSNMNVAIDPILPLCGNDDKPIALVGSPAGGVFQGAGVVDGVFYPNQAGIGVHELTYTISSTAPCPSSVARQTVEIHDSPKFDLLKEICVTNGIGFKIGVEESPGLRYEWLPKEGLNEPSISMPIVTTDVDRLYMLTVSNSNGCETSKAIQVKICSKFSIPDAFTPNQDGINDTWELKGIDKYPNAEVTIYNRWGNVIFHSNGYTKPFDGSSNQAGVYHYKVKLDDELPARTGPLMLIR